VFSLTPQAFGADNTSALASRLLTEIKASASPQAINVIFEGVANQFAGEAAPPVVGETFPDRLDRTVMFLNRHGYVARWEAADDGYLLHTCNCPYDPLATSHPELCTMDMALVTRLLGTTPQRICRVVEGGQTCAYLVRETEPARVPE
jgi:predicted ArsR family transcriptional regulator